MYRAKRLKKEKSRKQTTEIMGSDKGRRPEIQGYGTKEINNNAENLSQ